MATRKSFANVRGMGQLADRLGELASVPSRAAKGAAERINEELVRQFEEGVDPYGKPWEALAPRTLLKHDEPPLQGEFGQRPGDMADGTIASPGSGSGVELTVPFPGAIHQTGARKPPSWRMPARKILPDKGTLPESWREAIDASVSEAFAKTMGRRRAR